CIIINDTSSSSSYTFLTVSFSVKSSHIDRSAFTDDSELNVELLIENMKNTIMKKLLMLCVTESSVSLSALSVSFSAASLSHSSTPARVSDSPAPATATSAPPTLTLTTSGFTVSAFIISSPCFKEMLHRLDKP
ncbi:hypothetical protein BDFG_08562, partial [Blastomyces dermatitidis ATCC 26199]